MQALTVALAGHQVDVANYKPGIDFSYDDKDLIILSGGGGEGCEINDVVKPGKLWYEDEMELVLRADKPILGICMGFEVICRAHGGRIEELPTSVIEYGKMSLTKKGQSQFGKKTLTQYEAHEWYAPNVPSKLKALADSANGVQIIRHDKGLATQFHPEVPGGTYDLNFFINETLRLAPVVF